MAGSRNGTLLFCEQKVRTHVHNHIASVKTCARSLFVNPIAEVGAAESDHFEIHDYV